MKTSLFIIHLIIVSFFACKTKPTILGKTSIYFDSSQNPSITEEVALRSDSCWLRFRSDFNNDTVTIVSIDDIENIVVLKTDESIAYATTLGMKKDIDKNLLIKIAGISFLLKCFRDYLFIDIFYNRKDKKLQVHYSNNILVLS